MSTQDENNNNKNDKAKKMDHVVIAGSGVMGVTTAYYLAKEHGISSTIVDPSGTIAPAASGKAGGFLALDWNDYSPVGSLARRSYQLHSELAQRLGSDRIQYRTLTCAAITVASQQQQQGKDLKPKGKKLEGIEWANSGTGVRSLGDESTIAQVHPKLLCEALWEETMKQAPNSKLVQGTVKGPSYDEEDASMIKGIMINTGDNEDDYDSNSNTEELIKGDSLVFACGPWTCSQMTGIKYHSLVVPTTKPLSQCVFFSGAGDPEVYVRPDNTAYCTGFPDSPVRVTERPGKEEVRSEKINQILSAVQQATTTASTATDNENANDLILSLDDEKTLQQACYLPSTPDGLPMMGSVSHMPNCFVATGHTCWGILMGPGTGETMANLIATGKSPHVDVAYFNPSRFGTLDMVPNN